VSACAPAGGKYLVKVSSWYDLCADYHDAIEKGTFYYHFNVAGNVLTVQLPNGESETHDWSETCCCSYREWNESVTEPIDTGGMQGWTTINLWHEAAWHFPDNGMVEGIHKVACVKSMGSVLEGTYSMAGQLVSAE